MSYSGTRDGSTSSSGEPPDIRLTEEEIDTLLDELATIFNTAERASTFLRQARFPPALVPGFTEPYTFWTQVFTEIASGAWASPYRRLIRRALRTYGRNGVLRDLARRHGLSPDTSAVAEPPSESAVPSTPGPERQAPEQPEPQGCHLLVRIGSEQERDDVTAWLHEAGLEPQEIWSTETSVSFLLNEPEPERVREHIRSRPDLGWTLVPPGSPDYLLRSLFVEGPDGRRFRVTDVPVQMTVRGLTTEIVDQYPDIPGSDRPTVADHVGPGGDGRRMNPDNSLLDEGIGEGDHVRIGFQRTAAAPNPLDRQEALYGVRNQLQGYVDAHPEFQVVPNSVTLPTEYDLEFEQPSFGPPATRDGAPRRISRHHLTITLGPDLPITAPVVRWISEIFHPNVFPTYDSEALRNREHMRGLVCLGTLAEFYLPGMDFAELCDTLRDIAAYRNYSVFAPIPGADPRQGQAAFRGDFYNQAAAFWAASPEGQSLIAELGGSPLLPPPRPVSRYGLLIEPES